MHRTSDNTEFARAVTPFLSRDPVRNTVLLTVLDQLTVAPIPDSWFAWACDNGDVVGAALRTPPYGVALAAMQPAAAAALGAGDDSPGAVGRSDVVTAFAGARTVAVHMNETQYVLTDLRAPPTTPGSPRPYTPDDADTYVRWFGDFVAETRVHGGQDPLQSLERRLRTGGAVWFWERDGTPVAMAGRSAPVCGVPRIGPVWTPPEHRRNGYAAALTAHTCAEAFAAGVTACTLFADAANATSNGVYQRLGFEAVGEIVDARFRSATPDVS